MANKSTIKKMINRNWAIELWDQFDNVAKYTEKSIQFCEKYESFMKDRCTIEDDYARALKKLIKTYTPKLKEQEEFYNKFSYTIAFCSTLKELQDLASQHELISENLRESSIKKIQLTIKECREQRKKTLDEYNKIKRQFDKQHDLLIKLLRKYEECHESARRAKYNYEKAHEDLDLSRAQLEKARDSVTLKSKACDEAHANYATQVSLYNDTQRIFYERQLPSILSDLQQLDRKRSNELRENYLHFIQSHAEVLPRIQRCLDEMLKQTEQINSYADAQIIIDEYKSGYAIPNDEKVINLSADELSTPMYNEQEQSIYNEYARSNTLKSTNNDCSHQNGVTTIYTPSSYNINRTQTLMGGTPGIHFRKSSGAASTIRKIFGSSTQRKSGDVGMGMINAPYSCLPPAQRIRKFQEKILNCKNELEKKQKAKEGLTKMKHVFHENPKFGDEQNVKQQIVSIDENIEKLLAEIKRFESYISEIEQTRIPLSSDFDSSICLRNGYDSDQLLSNYKHDTLLDNRSSPGIPETNEDNIHDQSNEFHCLPSITSTTVNRTNMTTHKTSSSFEDDDNDTDSPYHEPINQDNCIKAYALYDFNGHNINGCQYVNAASIYVGECVDILEDDHGDGWTRIQKLDGSTGFVPSTYIRIDSQVPQTSSPEIESGRF